MLYVGVQDSYFASGCLGCGALDLVVRLCFDQVVFR